MEACCLIGWQIRFWYSWCQVFSNFREKFIQLISNGFIISNLMLVSNHKGNIMTWLFIHFFFLCPPGFTIKLNCRDVYAWRRRLLKMFFYFLLEFRIYLRLSSVSVRIKTSPCWICYECTNSKENCESCCGSRSPNNAEFGHFRLLCYGGRKTNARRIVMQVHGHCFAH